MKTDFFVFIISELTIILLFIFALATDLKNSQKSGGIEAEVTRGEKSMNALYVNFGVSTVVFTLIVQTCDTIKGNQSLFILINYMVLIYLFLLSSWFKNKLFFKFVNRVKKD